MGLDLIKHVPNGFRKLKGLTKKEKKITIITHNAPLGDFCKTLPA